MKSFLLNLLGDYAELWQEIPVYGYPWLVLATIVPLVPAILIVYRIKEMRDEGIHRRGHNCR